jgi:hypothetical protein
MMALNSPLPPATATAVRASADRATALVAEAERERAATWDASLCRLEQEWVDNGWPESSSPSTANELTWEWAFMCVHNGERFLGPSYPFIPQKVLQPFACTCRRTILKSFTLDCGATSSSNTFMSSPIHPSSTPPLPWVPPPGELPAPGRCRRLMISCLERCSSKYMSSFTHRSRTRNSQKIPL